MAEQRKDEAEKEDTRVKDRETMRQGNEQVSKRAEEKSSDTRQWSDRKSTVGSGPENLGASGNP